MASLSMTIDYPVKERKNIFVEIDAEKLERLAASLGFFNSDFIESVDRAEEDYAAGRMEIISSLKDLRS